MSDESAYEDEPEVDIEDEDVPEPPDDFGHGVEQSKDPDDVEDDDG